MKSGLLALRGFPDERESIEKIVNVHIAGLKTAKSKQAEAAHQACRCLSDCEEGCIVG